MKKPIPKQYEKNLFLSINQIQQEAEQLVRHNKYETYWQELQYVLDSFLNLLKNAKYQGGTENLYTTYQEEIEMTNNNIKKCVRYFLNGEINASYNSFNRRWNTLWKGNFDKTSTIFELAESTILYKLRKSEDKAFGRKDFFHVPFNLRGKIDNNRFSISGYPCLYLGRSIYTCWEELRRPKLSEISVAGFNVQKEIRLLDLRLKTNVKSSIAESNNISLLPYILASSIRVHSEGDHFKPEYIIPQLLLHSVIKNKDNLLYDYDGVIFTSTRRNINFIDRSIDLYDNIAIPVMNTRYSKYDKTLATYFIESAPIYFEHELLKGRIHCLNSSGDLKYNNTVFSALERIIEEDNDFKTIL